MLICWGAPVARSGFEHVQNIAALARAAVDPELTSRVRRSIPQSILCQIIW
jgi:hypothetical protein